MAFPTFDEVRTAIPAAGITVGSLVAKFKRRVGTRKAEFIHLMNMAGQLSKDPAKVGVLELKTAFPTFDEVRAAIPAAGIAMGSLVAYFESRLGTGTAEFIQLVKRVGGLSKDPAKVGLIEPKPGALTAFTYLDDEVLVATLWFHFLGTYRGW